MKRSIGRQATGTPQGTGFLEEFVIAQFVVKIPTFYLNRLVIVLLNNARLWTRCRPQNQKQFLSFNIIL